jgi:hypothetical protein
MAKKGCISVLVLLSVLFTKSEILAQEKLKKFEVGGHFSLLHENDKNKSHNSRVQVPGIGGRFAFNLSKILSLEAESTFYRNEHYDHPIPGTYLTSVNYSGPEVVNLFGVKAGIRTRKIGVFAKARPGFAISHPIISCPSEATNTAQCGEIRKKIFAIDLGLVVEGYFSRRAFVRLDAGDAYLRFGSTQLLFRPYATSPLRNFPFGPENRHLPQLSIGIGVRF